MITLRINLKKLLYNMLAHGTLIYSAFILFLYTADLLEPAKMYINAADTGKYLFIYCILAFTAAVFYVRFRINCIDCSAVSGGIVTALLPHTVIVLSLLTETLTITNRYNHSMSFITSDISKFVILLLSLSGAACALCLIQCVMVKFDEPSAKDNIQNNIQNNR